MGLKGAVLNRQRDQRKTGGGPPPSQVPFEDLILGIIGRDSSLISGIAAKPAATTGQKPPFNRPKPAATTSTTGEVKKPPRHLKGKGGPKKRKMEELQDSQAKFTDDEKIDLYRHSCPAGEKGGPRRQLASMFTTSLRRAVNGLQHSGSPQFERMQDLEACQHEIRWLSIGNCLPRLIVNWDALRDFFKAEEQSATESSVKKKAGDLRKKFQSPTNRPYCLFLADVIKVFDRINTELQAEEPK
ncbi:hypothetical protein BaRGS_00038830, partial [Batillaria attramentaria]